jgi:hypothetical protein
MPKSLVHHNNESRRHAEGRHYRPKFDERLAARGPRRRAGRRSRVALKRLGLLV